MMSLSLDLLVWNTMLNWRQHCHAFLLLESLSMLRSASFARASFGSLVTFIDQQGVHPDTEKISALLSLKLPSNVTELHRFLGMANQMGKFIPNLASLTQPLRKLLSIKHAWLWSSEQEELFN